MNRTPCIAACHRVAACLLILVGIAGCTTRPRVDWSARMGTYTYDQAVIDYGPPDKSAKLSDNSTVAEWVTSPGGYSVQSFGYGYYGRPYGPYGYYPGYAVGPDYVTRLPDRRLRLVFDPQGHLKGWNEFSR
jgi:hypothetical protein